MLFCSFLALLFFAPIFLTSTKVYAVTDCTAPMPSAGADGYMHLALGADNTLTVTVTNKNATTMKSVDFNHLDGGKWTSANITAVTTPAGWTFASASHDAWYNSSTGLVTNANATFAFKIHPTASATADGSSPPYFQMEMWSTTSLSGTNIFCDGSPWYVTIEGTPSIPSLSSAPDDRAVDLSWSALSGATYYNIKRGSTVVFTGSSNSYRDTGLTNGTAYTYTIQACNVSSCSAYGGSRTETPAVPVTSGGGISEAELIDGLTQYFTPRVKEVIGLFVAMLTGFLIIREFRWRHSK